MDAGTREQLRIIFSVALALVPRWMKRDWAERIIAKSDPAKAQIVERLITEVDRHFDVTEKPPKPVQPPHSVWRAGGGPIAAN
jgi:hypothetical protein